MEGMWSGPADKYEVLQAVRRVFLQGLENVARDGGVYDREAIAALQNGAGEYFDEMVSPTHKSGFEASQGLTASRITLVAESELELEIELGDLTRRLKEMQLDPLRRVYLRFVTLLDRPNMATSENPAGIDAITAGFTQMFAALGCGGDQSLRMLDLLETSLNNNLPALFGQLVDVLDRHSVRPAVAKIHGQSASHGGPGGGLGGSAGGGGNQQQGGGNGSAGAAGSGYDGSAPVERGTGSATSAREAGPLPAAGSPSTPLAGISREMLEQLFMRLDMLEAQGFRPAATETAAGPVPRSLDLGNLASLARQLGTSPGGQTSSENMARAIDRIARIFTAIFDHPTLPDSIKSAIGSLQTTVLKAAMLDDSFFDQADHPARAVLGRMVQVALGLPLDVGHDHPICAAVHEIAAGLRAGFKSDTRVFRHYLAELDVLIAARHEEISEAARPYIPALEQWEKTRKASVAVAALIDELIRTDMPPVILSFIRYDWARVLQLDYVETGPESPEWEMDLEVVRNLLRSIQPSNSPQERKQVVAAVPLLLARINAGFDRINLSKAERDAFLEACFNLQTNALRGIAPALAPRSAAASPGGANSQATSRQPRMIEVPVGEQRLEIWQNDVASETSAAETPFALGDWIDITLPEKARQCGRICWLEEDGGRCVLANPDWDHAISITPQVFAAWQDELQARKVDTTTLLAA